jgi:hypothetical protein
LHVNSALTNVNVCYNDITGEAAQQLAQAVLGSASLEVFSEVPMKQLRADALTELNLRRKGVGPAEGIVLAKLIEVSSVLTELNLYRNEIGDEGAKAIGAALHVNGALTTVLAFLNLAPAFLQHRTCTSCVRSSTCTTAESATRVPRRSATRCMLIAR